MPQEESAAASSVFRELFDRGAHWRGADWRRLLAQAARGLADLVFPPTCLACDKAVDQDGGLCGPCWRALRFIERPYCERLGTPFAQDFGPGLLSPEAIARPPVYGRARAAVRFEDGPARILVHALKYGDRTELARPLAKLMIRAGADLLAERPVVVPIPLHWSRLFKRQFNQAAALGAEVARGAGLVAAPLALQRVKATRSQVGMSRAQRMDNVQGAFRLAPGQEGMVLGRPVLVVDDVLTTGSTLNAAARVLLRAGAARVDALVFARVVTES